MYIDKGIIGFIIGVVSTIAVLIVIGLILQKKRWRVEVFGVGYI